VARPQSRCGRATQYADLFQYHTIFKYWLLTPTDERHAL